MKKLLVLCFILLSICNFNKIISPQLNKSINSITNKSLLLINYEHPKKVVPKWWQGLTI